MLTACSKFLLKSILGARLYDSPRTRTPEEQAKVECLLGIEDNEGDTPFLSATFRTNAKLLLFHLLGPLYVSLNETDATQLHRTAAEQSRVERIIVEKKNFHGQTALHKAMEIDLHSIDFQRLLLKNLLGEFYVEAPLEEALRPLHQQERIAHMMLPTDSKGMTPLNCLITMDGNYDSFELFLRNLLGDYFVEAGGQTAKSFADRSVEENKFVHNVIFSKLEYANFRYMDIMFGDENKYTLLIKANASYLQILFVKKIFRYVCPGVALLLTLLSCLYIFFNAPTSNLISSRNNNGVGYYEKPWEMLSDFGATLFFISFVIIGLYSWLVNQRIT